jgi:BCD family chlorophyll transporter-like MFS transporter
MGTLLQFGGLAVMPFALLVLGGGGNAQAWPAWMGPLSAAIAFGLVGAGLHTTQTAGLALATDLAPTGSQPRVVGLMYVSLLAGTIVAALAFGAFLREFTPGRLVQVIQAAAVVTLILNSVALWKQEARHAARGAHAPAAGTFSEAWALFIAGDGARRRLVAIGLGTMAFAMQDVLLEPYGGQVLGMSVGSTTWLTATLAAGGLAGFSAASAILGGGADAARLARFGVLLGIPGFAAVLSAPAMESVACLAVGAFTIGAGGGLFAHGTLTVTMNRAPRDQIGLALGAWGAVQATSAGLAVALGGILRDLIGSIALGGGLGAELAHPATGYQAVYLLEIALLTATIYAMQTLIGPRTGRDTAGAAPPALRRSH